MAHSRAGLGEAARSLKHLAGLKVKVLGTGASWKGVPLAEPDMVKSSPKSRVIYIIHRLRQHSTVYTDIYQEITHRLNN